MNVVLLRFVVSTIANSAFAKQKNKNRFVGGVIHIKPKSGFKIGKLTEFAFNKKFEVKPYISKVAPNKHTTLIQMVFAEEDGYTGKSAKIAQEFFNILHNNSKIFTFLKSCNRMGVGYLPHLFVLCVLIIV